MLPFTPIGEENLRQFDEQGYLIVRKAIDEETIESIIEAGDRLIASNDQGSRQSRTDGRYDGFRNVVVKDDAFLPLIDHPTILPLVIQLLGADLHMITSHLIYKKPDPPETRPSHRDPGWHRDYFSAQNDLGHYSIPRIELKCAYYLTDLTEPNSGVTMVVPGSNQLKEPITFPNGAGDPRGALEPSLQPGDCLIFENRTWHAGAANLNGRSRKAIMMGYGYRWVKPMDYRYQPAQFIEKLSPLQRFLCGEAYDDVQQFQFDGGANPFKDWCTEYGVPAVRHYHPNTGYNHSSGR